MNDYQVALVAGEAQPSDEQGAEARPTLAETPDRGHRKFEAAPDRARARVPRHSPRSTPQQLDGTQIRADGAFTMKSPALALAAPRRQVAGDVVRSPPEIGRSSDTIPRITICAVLDRNGERSIFPTAHRPAEREANRLPRIPPAPRRIASMIAAGGETLPEIATRSRWPADRDDGSGWPASIAAGQAALEDGDRSIRPPIPAGLASRVQTAQDSCAKLCAGAVKEPLNRPAAGPPTRALHITRATPGAPPPGSHHPASRR